MRIRLSIVAVLCAAIALPAATLTPVARAGDRATYYLSLGDSLAQGYQPIGGPPVFGGAPPGYDQG
jgi:hypothetical protein